MSAPWKDSLWPHIYEYHLLQTSWIISSELRLWISHSVTLFMFSPLGNIAEVTVILFFSPISGKGASVLPSLCVSYHFTCHTVPKANSLTIFHCQERSFAFVIHILPKDKSKSKMLILIMAPVKHPSFKEMVAECDFVDNMWKASRAIQEGMGGKTDSIFTTHSQSGSRPGSALQRPTAARA